MGVSTTNKQYDDLKKRWQKIADAMAGGQAVKSAGERYLSRLAGQTAEQYEKYKDRALFFNVVRRVHKAMSSLAFRRPAQVSGNLLGVPLSDNAEIAYGDDTLDAVARTCFKQVLSYGRAGLLVDAPNGEYASDDAEPYLVPYDANAIINWRYSDAPDGRELALVVLWEALEVPSESDPYTSETKNAYRVLEMRDGAYWQSYYLDTGQEIALQWEISPTVSGAQLPYIPFFIIGSESNTFDEQSIPLEDLADLAISDYRTSADLENGRHWVGIPQPFMAGFSNDIQQWQIGGDKIWQSAEPSARVGFLEFTGGGLSSLETAVKEKEEKMIVLGMKLLDPSSGGAEKPEAIRLKLVGETAILQDISRLVSDGVTAALQELDRWGGLSSENELPVYAISADVSLAGVDVAVLQFLQGLWRDGGISYETLYYNIEKAGATRDGVSATMELETVSANEPKL